MTSILEENVTFLSEQDFLNLVSNWALS